MRTDDDIRAAFAAVAADAPAADDVLARLHLGRPEPRVAHHRLWVAVGAAAAAVAVVAAALAWTGRSPDHSPPAARPTAVPTVVCRAATTPSVSVAAAEVRALAARARALKLKQVTVSGQGADFTLQSPDADAAQLAELCAATSVELRPVVLAVASARTANPTDPLTRLGFAVPGSDPAVAALSTAQRAALAAAVSASSCATPGGDNPQQPAVACDGQGTSYLLGPAVVRGSDVTSAAAVAPTVSAGGSAEWTVAVQLTPASQVAWANYTSRHDAGGSAAARNADVTRCGASTVPCADYVGFLSNGRVLSAPLTVKPINGGSTQVSGGFTQDAATTLAAQLSAQLPVPLTVQP